MPDAQPKRTPQPAYDAGHVPITEEMDSARWTLPPMVPVLIAALVIGAILGVYLLSSRKPPTSFGSITRMEAIPVHVESNRSMGAQGLITNDVEKFDQMIVAVQISINNATDKPMYIKDVEAKLTTDQGEFPDEAAAPSDYERLFQAYPKLKENAIPPLRAESKLAAAEQHQGMAIFSFHVTKDAWDKRKSLKVAVNLYDHNPLVLDTAQITPQ
jgi:fructose-specific phosphotransferase system component IIB